MSVAADVALPRKQGVGAGVVFLLALAVFINYVDRGNLPTAAPLIKDELKLDATQIGLLLSAFFWAYMPAQILAGWISERINAYRTLALGLAIWSIATVFMGFATGFWALIVLRLLLGLGESAAFPCSSKLLAQHLPTHRLGSANGLISVGLALGPAFGTFVGGHLMASIGWRGVFVLSGLVSLLWLWPWLAATGAASRGSAGLAQEENAPSFLSILRRRETWGAGFGHFASNYSFYFVVTWLPFYLVKARGFSVPEMATLSGIIYVVYAVVSVVAGRLSDALVQTGASTNFVRKAFVIASNVGAASAMLGCIFGGQVATASLFVAAVSFGLNTPSVFVIGQTLAGPRAAGKWMSLQNCMGNVAGLVAPTITGIVVDRTGAFTWAFVLSFAVTLLFGVVGWGFMIRKVAPLDWSEADRKSFV